MRAENCPHILTRRNVKHFKMRGFVPLDDVKKEIKKTTFEEISDKIVKLKPKKKKNVKKTKKKD